MDRYDITLAPCGLDCSACGTEPCDGCSGDRSGCWSEDCAIYHCSAGKGHNHCGECGEFEACGHIAEFNKHYESHFNAVTRLRTLRSRKG